jgi:hypothetical protein
MRHAPTPLGIKSPIAPGRRSGLAPSSPSRNEPICDVLDTTQRSHLRHLRRCARNPISTREALRNEPICGPQPLIFHQLEEIPPGAPARSPRRTRPTRGRSKARWQGTGIARIPRARPRADVRALRGRCVLTERTHLRSATCFGPWPCGNRPRRTGRENPAPRPDPPRPLPLPGLSIPDPTGESPSAIVGSSPAARVRSTGRTHFNDKPRDLETTCVIPSGRTDRRRTEFRAHSATLRPSPSPPACQLGSSPGTTC